MASMKDFVSMDHSAAIRQPMADLANHILPIVADACHASDVAMCLSDTSIGIGSTFTYSEQDGTDRIDALRDFLETRTQHNRRLLHSNDPSGAGVIFLKLPLQVSGEILGELAVAIPENMWAEQRVFETCSRVASLVALNFASSSSKFQLEVDLADMGRRTKSLVRRAEIDPLTKVENKGSFEIKARRRLAQRDRPAALVAIDLDFFKQVNDIYGHQFGDRYLENVSQSLKSIFSKNAIIGRTGGDEFCILMDIPEAGRSYLESEIESLRVTVRRNIAVLGKHDLGKMSIGISLFPRQASSYEPLLEKADRALYASKRTERNSTTVFSNSLDGLAETTECGKVRFDSIATYFQPIYCTETSKCAGFEVLARWRDAERGMLGPDSFSWMFQDHRFASKLTLHIVETALTDLSEQNLLSGEDVPDLWINVTSHDLLDPEFVFELQGVLAAFGVGWGSIVVEVNEECILGETSGQLFHSLQELQQRGARVAFDDFGTGYAGLTHVRNWPVDIIKIDQTFIDNLGSDEGADVLVRALVMIASAMGHQVVAEGVETPEQMTAVRELGCTYAQGFLMARPMPGAEIPLLPLTYTKGQSGNCAA